MSARATAAQIDRICIRVRAAELHRFGRSLPAEPARRVALYIDGCGDPGFGCIAPVISTSNGLVIWNDFRNVMNIDEAPILELYPAQSTSLSVPEQIFDARQYSGEVMRISAAREWEAPPWRTALLLDDYLSADPWSLGQWQLGWVEPVQSEADAYSVTCWDENVETGIITIIKPRPGTPEQRAREMADFLIATPTNRWPRARPIHANP
jgi:hypothetical protein